MTKGEAPSPSHAAERFVLLQQRYLRVGHLSKTNGAHEIHAACRASATIIGAVLSGIGQDGAVGSQHIRMVGGRVLVQDPASAIAPQMARNVVGLRAASEVLSLEEMAPGIARHIAGLRVEQSPALR